MTLEEVLTDADTRELVMNAVSEQVEGIKGLRYFFLMLLLAKRNDDFQIEEVDSETFAQWLATPPKFTVIRKNRKEDLEEVVKDFLQKVEQLPIMYIYFVCILTVRSLNFKKW